MRIEKAFYNISLRGCRYDESPKSRMLSCEVEDFSFIQITEGATERISEGNAPTYENTLTMM